MNKKSQVLNTCSNCGENTKGSMLCAVCAGNPYLVEDGRDLVARNGDATLFKSLYKSSFPEIKNVNSGKFWNEHFNSALTLKDQDLMTRDKIHKIKSLIPNKKLKILDLGFGQGYIEELLNDNKNYELYGIDISSTAVKRAKKKFKGNFITGDISKIETHYKKNFFDVILALELMEHISPTKIFNFYKSLHSLLKPHGILIISTPLNEDLRNKKENPSGHVRDYQPAVIKMEQELSGFRILESHTFYAFEKNYKIKKFLTRVFPNHWKPNNIVVKSEKM
ncbi:MAG: class I SAM-dependent methyltransferase [Candidatus Levybacteria bacterium]|nr:class I SAM-dependent methyltransferase [Candidatus Levybacteria bacterium]